MKKLTIIFISIFTFCLLGVKQALAVCPICTVAVVAGVGFSRWLGIDDSVTGLWIGGLTVSMITWTMSWYEKKNIRFKGKGILTIIGYYLLIVVPLFFIGMIGNPLNTICTCGADKLLIGIIVGSLGFWSGAEWYFYLKAKNNGHAYFPFQKVVMPVSPLIILSIIFYYLTK